MNDSSVSLEYLHRQQRNWSILGDGDPEGKEVSFRVSLRESSQDPSDRLVRAVIEGVSKTDLLGESITWVSLCSDMQATTRMTDPEDMERRILQRTGGTIALGSMRQFSVESREQ